jgi:hypothetical protein
MLSSSSGGFYDAIESIGGVVAHWPLANADEWAINVTDEIPEIVGGSDGTLDYIKSTPGTGGSLLSQYTADPIANGGASAACWAKQNENKFQERWLGDVSSVGSAVGVSFTVVWWWRIGNYTSRSTQGPNVFINGFSGEFMQFSSTPSNALTWKNLDPTGATSGFKPVITAGSYVYGLSAARYDYNGAPAAGLVDGAFRVGTGSITSQLYTSPTAGGTPGYFRMYLKTQNDNTGSPSGEEKVQDVVLFNSYLSDAQIEELYQAGTTA